MEIGIFRQILRLGGAAGVQAVDVAILDLDRRDGLLSGLTRFGMLHERKKLGVVIQFLRLLAPHLKAAGHPDDRQCKEQPDAHGHKFLVVQMCFLL